MTEIEQLQTGQVPFISGLMAGFAISIAGQIIRGNTKGFVATTGFILFAVCSLLFLVALYIDVALTLRIAGIEQFSDSLLEQIGALRNVGTSSATIATFLFVASIGWMAWMQSKWAGIITGTVALAVLITIVIARQMIFSLG